MADITFRDFPATSIYGHIQEELDSMPEMHPTVINAHAKLLTKVACPYSFVNTRKLSGFVKAKGFIIFFLRV